VVRESSVQHGNRLNVRVSVWSQTTGYSHGNGTPASSANTGGPQDAEAVCGEIERLRVWLATMETHAAAEKRYAAAEKSSGALIRLAMLENEFLELQTSEVDATLNGDYATAGRSKKAKQRLLVEFERIRSDEYWEVTAKDLSVAAEQEPEEVIRTNSVPVKFKIKMETEFGQHVAMVGDIDELGMWDPSRAVMMDYTPNGWSATLRLERGEGFRYKFILREPYVGDDGQEGVAYHWQEGDDRFIQLPLEDVISVDVQGSWADTPENEHMWMCCHIARLQSKEDEEGRKRREEEEQHHHHEG